MGYPVMPTLTGATTYAANPPTWDDGFYYLTGGSAAQYPNIPFDHPSNTAGVTPNPTVTPDGTTLQYTNIYLQRLANPLAPWDFTANPYITVDSMPLDLTAYSGESLTGPTKVEPAYPNATGTGTTGFDGRSRGELPSGTVALDAPNIWVPSSTAPNGWTGKAPRQPRYSTARLGS